MATKIVYIKYMCGLKTQHAKRKFWNANAFLQNVDSNVVDCVDQMKYSAPERNQNVISKRKSG